MSQDDVIALTAAILSPILFILTFVLVFEGMKRSEHK